MQALATVEATTHATYNCIETFEMPIDTWANWSNPWVLQASLGYNAFAAAGHSVVLSIDLIPKSVENQSNPLTWEQACDSGTYNSYATTLAQNLVAGGQGNDVIRLGPEMNGDWEVDFVGSLNGGDSTSTAEMSDWAGCFAQEVTAMRAVAGAHFLFDWNPNVCVGNFVLSSLYPGNAYVDLIGADLYDAFCNGSNPAPSAARWSSLYNEPASSYSVTMSTNLQQINAFAQSKGKAMSLPEWGLTSGTGDDPYYIQGVASYVANNDVAFQSYYDVGDNGIPTLSSADPLSLSAYIAAF